MTWGERLIGVALGLLLGLVIVAVFIFLLSGETIDAPSISDEATEPGGTEERVIPEPPPAEGPGGPQGVESGDQ